MHNGGAARGVSSKRFKHGRYSKVLTGGMLKNYERYLKDPNARDNIEALALLNALILDDAESLKLNSQLWVEAKTIFAELKGSLAKDQISIESRASLAELEVTLKNGGTDAKARVEIRANLDLSSKIKERAAREDVMLKNVVAMEQFLTLAALTHDLIVRYIPEEKLDEFEREYTKFIN